MTTLYPLPALSTKRFTRNFCTLHSRFLTKEGELPDHTPPQTCKPFPDSHPSLRARGASHLHCRQRHGEPPLTHSPEDSRRAGNARARAPGWHRHSRAAMAARGMPRHPAARRASSSDSAARNGQSEPTSKPATEMWFLRRIAAGIRRLALKVGLGGAAPRSPRLGWPRVCSPLNQTVGKRGSAHGMSRWWGWKVCLLPGDLSVPGRGLELPTATAALPALRGTQPAGNLTQKTLKFLFNHGCVFLIKALTASQWGQGGIAECNWGSPGQRRWERLGERRGGHGDEERGWGTRRAATRMRRGAVGMRRAMSTSRGAKGWGGGPWRWGEGPWAWREEPGDEEADHGDKEGGLGMRKGAMRMRKEATGMRRGAMSTSRGAKGRGERPQGWGEGP